MEKNWYNQSPDETLKNLSTTKEKGLSHEEAQNRLQEYGENALEAEKKKSFGEKLKEQILDPMIIILIAAAIVSVFVGEALDAGIIIAIVIVNAFLSIYQEGKAEEAIEALQKMSSPKAKVIRDGEHEEVDSNKLVPGDIIVLETGDIVPADLRLIESSNLKVDESSLTGESVAVEKHYDAIYSGKMEIGDRENLAYSSTIVTYGRGMGVVIETGHNTEIGKIATSIATVGEEQTPLQRKLAKLSKTLGILVIVICAVVMAVGLLYKHDPLDMFMTAISLAVAAVPEGLPAIVTIVLSIGMGKMAEKNAIVKKLLAVETLGTTTVICSDKTGTLTQNEMTVVKVFTDGNVYDVSGTGYVPEGDVTKKEEVVTIEDDENLKILSSIAALTNDAKLKVKGSEASITGDPTEGALLTFAEKAGNGLENLYKKFDRLEEIPFDSDRKMMTTFHDKIFDEITSFTKGAPDVVLDRCSKILIGGEEVELDDKLKKEVLDKNSEFARSALRCLGYAYRKHKTLPSELTSEVVEKDMVFVGLTGMIDPSRPEVKDAIKECRSAGIRPIMITGDYLETGLAIAKDLGIAKSDDEAIMGRELNEMSEAELREIVKKKSVFTRVSPENKVQIVTALKQNGHIAAMTGDGVNDAPAIKKADIGIAMGITGTDVAKNTAEVILTDDNFATIVNAVEEGRIIYSNIKKFVAYLLSCNLGEVLIVLISILMNLPVPLIPIQLLWLNLVTDSFPALALGVERGEADIMKEKPRDPDEPILDTEIKITVAIQSIAITVATLLAYFIGLKWYGLGEGLHHARTMAFSSLIICELLRSYTARSIDKTVFEIGVFTNKKLVMATAFSFLLMLVVIYVPVLNDAFGLMDLGPREIAVVLGSAVIPLLAGEIQKKVRFRKNK
ncbi:MAG: calcium-translocating P-type ATPase, SERCA-type [Peptoniphilus sp.]|uniref:calcium-translocating P-type ATPase, SERCA-type n=1 Tax=Peptoniphilus sp. TaxID=1971214 RepID=UPI0025E9AC41|nr:calcium-translocating P-type ATPase, SERCA-type [Peptoniphilus sp.]MCI5642964.1 calcium-translocating P-type ATPase, SERCA-type [Peptoniphilus sp.]MDD7352537.1 calcium-translocating P-type ATPase, SERCA-type [Peptoniphilaceae bacterium]